MARIQDQHLTRIVVCSDRLKHPYHFAGLRCPNWTTTEAGGNTKLASYILVYLGPRGVNTAKDSTTYVAPGSSRRSRPPHLDMPNKAVTGQANWSCCHYSLAKTQHCHVVRIECQVF